MRRPVASVASCAARSSLHGAVWCPPHHTALSSPHARLPPTARAPPVAGYRGQTAAVARCSSLVSGQTAVLSRPPLAAPRWLAARRAATRCSRLDSGPAAAPRLPQSPTAPRECGGRHKTEAAKGSTQRTIRRPRGGDGRVRQEGPGAYQPHGGEERNVARAALVDPHLRLHLQPPAHPASPPFFALAPCPSTVRVAPPGPR